MSNMLSIKTWDGGILIMTEVKRILRIDPYMEVPIGLFEASEDPKIEATTVRTIDHAKEKLEEWADEGIKVNLLSCFAHVETAAPEALKQLTAFLEELGLKKGISLLPDKQALETDDISGTKELFWCYEKAMADMLFFDPSEFRDMHDCKLEIADSINFIHKNLRLYMNEEWGTNYPTSLSAYEKSNASDISAKQTKPQVNGAKAQIT